MRDGRLELVDDGDSRVPDLAIRFRELAVREVLLGTAATCDAFRDAEVAVDDRWCPVVPVAEEQLPSASVGHFECIPGASLSVVTQVTSTMFGGVGIRERWQDGALVSSELMPVPQLEGFQADVRMACSLAQLSALRRCALTPLDAVADGVGIQGDWPQLMCFFELIQHSAYAQVWANPSVNAQVAWGEVFCSQAYGEAAMRAQDDSAVMQ